MKKFGNIYFHGNRELNQIALTFDDGPSYETGGILNLLNQYDARATFFIWGQRINGHEKIIERMIKEGHEIGNHSYNHKRLIFKSQKYIEDDLKKCDEELSKLNIKTNIFRPPYFSFFFNLLKVCKRLEKKIIICDVISNDWKKKGTEYVTKKVLDDTRNSSILNFHDYLKGIGDNEDIIPILENILPKLKEKYKLVTVSQLLFDKKEISRTF